mmetsp:Transcript_517/g.1276  ORF Transcript_517/g.1276 Transcript_517/m.1276 type:complete len:335 (+) Transcript_517:165-1169(+)|eukprot:CAMPEP_0171493288 /NCGR_PEP_ID=MMETSP0958-20121227/4882_1 /TAXON_ID=87120 /ORGANISM="Aurantiochytrium limacinum, Strain ATCCMYA-1381" /LENGTH=334 /DNA_ID=CAMNT_0012026901 /DNA_START=107 /DNA_END=1111 /DNA_ORIENTATION=+
MASAQGLVALPVLCGALPVELEAWAEKASPRLGLAATKKRKRQQVSAELAQTAEGRKLVKYLFLKLHGAQKLRVGNTLKAQGGDSEDDASSDSDDDNEDEGATLFVANVGVTWTRDIVRKVFELFGEVDSVALGQSGTSRFARVQFATKMGAMRALDRAALASKEGPVDASEAWKKTGVEDAEDTEVATKLAKRSKKVPRWMQQYETERPGMTKLKESSESYMERFAELEKEIEILRKEQEKQVDDDGFTMVSYRKGSRARAPTVASESSAKVSRKLTDGTGKKKNANAPLADFYKFQTRDQKKSKLAELRAKFEQDKQQIERLKASRRFRPLS